MQEQLSSLKIDPGNVAVRFTEVEVVLHFKQSAFFAFEQKKPFVAARYVESAQSNNREYQQSGNDHKKCGLLAYPVKRKICPLFHHPIPALMFAAVSDDY